MTDRIDTAAERAKLAQVRRGEDFAISGSEDRWIEDMKAGVYDTPRDTEVIITVADEIMSDLSGYLDGSLTADDEMEAVDLVRRTIASTFPAPGWQPIETAPRDGTAILASGLDHGKGPGRHYSVVEWMDFGCESGWYPDEDSSPLIYLSHWMPLPAPPSKEGKP